MLEKLALGDFKAHALRSYPQECCGLVVLTEQGQKYIECHNSAEKGKDSFRISAEERSYAEDQGEVIALAHSHPDWVNTPSEADRVACEASELVWAIVSVNDGIVSEPFYLKPQGSVAPLIGREFFHGVLDCYSLIRDYYLREHDIFLLDFEREDGWWEKDQELYLDNFEKAGFRRLLPEEEIAESDVIVMSVRSSKANHAGVYIGQRRLKECPHLARVPNAMLHHIYGRLSERAVYGGYWQDQTRAVLRHKCLEK